MEDCFELYNKKEIEKLIKEQEKLVYVDDGIDEVIVRVEDLPDFIVDVNNRTGQSSNLIIYDFHNPSMTPIATTIGCHLDKCEPKFRREFIERLVDLQKGKKVKKYKIIDEVMFGDVREKLLSQKVLSEYGDIVEYKGMIAEIEDTNDNNYKEKIVKLFSSQEDYNSKNYTEIVSLNSINLERNIKDYIDTKYRNNMITSEKAYFTFVLGYDLLNDMLTKSSTSENDISYDFCNTIAEQFLKSEEYRNEKYSSYEMLEYWVNNNKNYIKNQHDLFFEQKSNNKIGKLEDGITVISVGYRDEQPVALVKRETDYGVEYVVAFNYEIDNDQINWAYGSYYGTDLPKAKQDFNKVLNGGTLYKTFDRDDER